MDTTSALALCRGRARHVWPLTTLALFLFAAPAWADLPPSCTNFTDTQLVAGIVVKSDHLTQLRTCINDLRLQRGLTAAIWTDPVITPQVTTAKAAHITELRTALNGAYFASGPQSVTFGAPPVATQSVITASFVNELRGAIAAIAPPGGCSANTLPATAAVPGAAGSASFTLEANCAWTASSSATWLRPLSASGTAGSQTISFEFDENTSGVRSAMITIGGAQFVVTQNNCSCDLIVNGSFEQGFSDINSGDITGRLAASWQTNGGQIVFSEGGVANDREQQVEATGVGGLFQLVAMPPNQTYVVTADVHVNGGGVSLSIDNTISPSPLSVTAMGPGGHRLRITYSHQVTLQPNDVRVAVASVGAGADFRVDNVSLRPLALDTADERVVNGRFNLGFRDYNDGQSAGRLGNAWNRFGNSSSSVVFDEVDSQQFVEHADIGDGIGQVVTVMPGQRYLLRATVAGISGSARIGVGPVGAAATQTSRWCGGGGTPHILALLYTPPTGTTSVTVSIAGALNDTSFNVDDVSMLPTTLTFVDPGAPQGECLPRHSVTFQVHDASTQDPVEGALIEINPSWGTGPPRSTLADGAVNYSVGGGPLQYTVSKSGYVTASGTIDVSTGITWAIALSPGTSNTCALSVSPESVVLGNGQTTASFTVTTPSGCAWNATSTQSFVSITSGSSGTGSGTVNYMVAANTPGTTIRIGSIEVNRKTHSLIQGNAVDPGLIGFDYDAGVVWNQTENALYFGGYTQNSPVTHDEADFDVWNGEYCGCRMYWESWVAVELNLEFPDGFARSYGDGGTARGEISGRISSPPSGRWILRSYHRQIRRWYRVFYDPEYPELGPQYEHVLTAPYVEVPLIDDAYVGAAEARLTLFIDADGNFDRNKPLSDHPAYIPGANPSTGLSVALPQVVRVLAAYIGPDNKIVPPPTSGSVGFSLSDFTAFVGYAMNAGNSQDPDYELAATSAEFGSTGIDGVAEVNLLAHDYGGFAQLNAIHNQTTAALKIPVDSEANGQGNGIPDVGWKATANGQVLDLVSDSGNLTFSGDDLDTLPPGLGPGDGLTAFEEYRGFMVRGEHRRTTPNQKDIFIDSTVPTNIGYAVNLPLLKHAVASDELANGANLYVVNANYVNAGQGGPVIIGHQDQHGIAVREEPALVAGVTYGDAGCNYPCTPNTPHPVSNQVEPAVVYAQNIGAIAPDVDAWNRGRMKTTAHEIGHKIGMNHYTYVGSRLTVMVSGFLPPSQPGGYVNPQWTNIPSSYDSQDVSQIRVRQ